MECVKREILNEPSYGIQKEKVYHRLSYGILKRRVHQHALLWNT
jgi:hypothetical protein